MKTTGVLDTFSSDSSLDIKIHSSKQNELNIRTEFKKISILELGTCILNRMILTINSLHWLYEEEQHKHKQSPITCQNMELSQGI